MANLKLVAYDVSVGLSVSDDTIGIADNVAYDVAVGLGAIDDAIEIAGPRCKKLQRW